MAIALPSSGQDKITPTIVPRGDVPHNKPPPSPAQQQGINNYKTHLLLELETLALVLVLQLDLLNLHALERLNILLHLHRQALDVARALANESRELSMNEPKHRLLDRSSRLLLLRLIVLRNIRHGGARETLSDGGVCERRVLRRRRRRVDLVDGDVERHRCGQRAGEKWRSRRKKERAARAKSPGCRSSNGPLCAPPRPRAQCPAAGLSLFSTCLQLFATATRSMKYREYREAAREAV